MEALKAVGVLFPVGLLILWQAAQADRIDVMQRANAAQQEALERQAKRIETLEASDSAAHRRIDRQCRNMVRAISVYTPEQLEKLDQTLFDERFIEVSPIKEWMAEQRIESWASKPDSK